MADHHHHHHHRPHRLSLPSRTAIPTTIAAAAATSTPRSYPVYPYPPSTPTPTPSKHRLSILNINNKSPTKKTSLSFLFLLLFSLRSLYSLLPFLRSSPSSFSIFPFSFLVSLLSFLFSFAFSLFSPSSSRQKQQLQPIFSLSSISPSQHRLLLSKSLLLAIVFLIRFQALLYCGTAAMILAELSGNVAARFFFEGRNRHLDRIRSSKVRGFFLLFIGLFLLSVSWDRIECFPFSAVNVAKFGFSVVPSENSDGDSISIGSLGWPLANTVVFGVLLSENYSDEKLVNSKDLQREFLVTFVCTLLLELFYFPELSLWGLLICGLLLGIAVRELDPLYSSYLELGLERSDSFTTLIMKPIRHILSERKSRKIALFLLINTGYMVVEFVAGFMSNSLGLISDACHMLFDCAALAIGLYASYISRLPANSQFNYGRGRFEVLSGYVNAVFLVLVGALIVLESFERILDPQEISTNSLLTVSVGGLLVNVVGLIFFHEEHHHAHGGTGSCSHSHSNSNSNSSVHHHHHSHDHKAHGHDHECIVVSNDSHEKPCSGHNDSCSDTHVHQDWGDSHVRGNLHNHAHSSDLEVHLSSKNSTSQQKELPSHKEDVQKHHHHHIDHNMEGIFLHVLADTLGSVGVVISTLLIKYKGWLVADPACSIFISVLIVSSVIPLLRNSAEILLQRVPKAHEQDLKEAINDIVKIKGVCGIQNLHVWSFTSTDVVGTLHLHVSTEKDKASAKAQVSHILHDAGVKDLTVQVECAKGTRSQLSKYNMEGVAEKLISLTKQQVHTKCCANIIWMSWSLLQIVTDLEQLYLSLIISIQMSHPDIPEIGSFKANTGSSSPPLTQHLAPVEETATGSVL
ncbi:hypothetical protein TEA_005682 [Camellia sinensis var. sinensis]|uniref:Cation efflux protein transmembrane domain-containing protein n=1 Tax=Camellia sinensis var. sinensis TaxID=542762 RepID=A0A4S4EQM7_CAMSN|nr:hypothetical protein TEA_005682 [Camellia sinensis var. sinensis]